MNLMLCSNVLKMISMKTTKINEVSKVHARRRYVWCQGTLGLIGVKVLI